MYFYTFLLFDHPSHAQICAAGEVTGKLQLSGMYWWKKLHEKLLPWIELGGLLFGQLDSNSARPFYLVGPDQSTHEIRRWIPAYESFQLAHLQNSLLHMYYTLLHKLSVLNAFCSKWGVCTSAASAAREFQVSPSLSSRCRTSRDPAIIRWPLASTSWGARRASLESGCECMINYGKWAANRRHTHRIIYIDITRF